MAVSDVDRLITGSIPQLYDEYMVPLIFEPYASDLASRVAILRPSSLLEIAAGTGVVTRHLAYSLAPDVRIVATDLNQAMIDRATAVGTARPVEWRQADAMQLPFPDESFDVVVCQFGAMFYPDKPKAFSEARRVLRSGGTFVFNVWDSIDQNEFAEAVTFALQQMFPDKKILVEDGTYPWAIRHQPLPHAAVVQQRSQGTPRPFRKSAIDLARFRCFNRTQRSLLRTQLPSPVRILLAFAKRK